MVNNLIGEDIVLMRKRYDEALNLQGIPCRYQFPNLAQSNDQGEPMIDSYSDFIDAYVFFESSPKIKTIKRFGWVVENHEDLPFLIHCSWNLPHVQKDALFRISGQYSELPERIFRVTEIAYDLQAPDHLVCKIIPCYDEKNLTGRTPTEIKKTFNKSNHFLKQPVDYRGDYYTTQTDKR